MEFPTLFTPLIHHAWFQLPLGDSQTSDRPSGGRLAPPQKCTRNFLCAESPSPQRALQLVNGANVLVTQGDHFEENYTDLDI